MKKRYLSKAFYLLTGFIVFNVIWQVAAMMLNMNALPEPWRVYSSVGKALNSNILAHTGASMYRVGMGLAISLVVGTVTGIAMGYSPRVNRALWPVVYLSYPVPKLALLPVIMIFMGIGEAAKITVIVLNIVFQLIISIRDAVQTIPQENYDVFVSLHANAWDKIRHITFPAAVPAILSSLRVSTGIAISVLIVAETYGTTKGLGWYVIDSWMRADYIQMYLGIFILSVFGLAVFVILDIIEGYISRWKK